MDNDIIKLKFDIMDAIQKEYPSCRKVGMNQYRMRCPICGDSQSNPKEAHMYLKCDFDSEEPILYNCFKGNCQAKGKIDAKFLKQIGVKVKGIDKLSSQVYNKISNYKNLEFDVVCGEPIKDSYQMKYIEWRLGKGFNIDDYNKFKIIWDYNKFYECISNKKINIPPNDKNISFLSSDKSMVLSRSFNDNGMYSWLKTHIFNSSNVNEYSISTELDIFTKDQIYINISEGIFDILSVYKNFNTGDNSAYVAVLGSRYESGIQNIINKGLFGKNVNVNIYADTDINLSALKYSLLKYKWLFNKISIYTNILYKDVGVTIDKIKLKEMVI